MRCSEEFLAQLRALHEAAADTDGRTSRTDILHDLVDKASETLALADRAQAQNGGPE